MDQVRAHLEAYLEAVATLPTADSAREGETLWVTTEIGWPMFNGAIGPPDDGVHERLRAHGRPYFWWDVGDGAPPGLGMFDLSPWEQARIADLPPVEMPPGVTVSEVRDEPSTLLWAATMRSVYGFPEQGEVAWATPGRLLGYEGMPWRQWIAFLDGEPVGTTLLFCGAGIAGLFGVGTHESARRRGIGRVLTLLPLHESGMDTAGFFSTEVGGHLYRSLGFKTSRTVIRWLGGRESL